MQTGLCNPSFIHRAAEATTTMDVDLLRKQSVSTASRLGLSVTPHLPLLESDLRLREIDAIVERCMCLHAVAACAHGFSRETALLWLDGEGLKEALSTREAMFLSRGVGERQAFMDMVEGLWAFAWALQKVESLDFSRGCADDFVAMWPDLKRGESSEAFRRAAHRRSLEEVAGAVDLAYCLHWAIRQAALDGRALPRRIKEYVIVERRRALEWLVGTEDWDAVSLDT